GKRPTIERVRLKIGRGSPNTVSPMLERWFASLGERVVGVKPAAGKITGNDSDGMPTSVRNAARLLWETARREAEEVQRAAHESAQADLQGREEALAVAQAALAQREEAFAQARSSLDVALASSQHARETLDRQLKEHAAEAQRVRADLEEDVKRLTALLGQAAAAHEQARQEHTEIVAAKDQDLRQAIERHAGQEKHMLAEVDRARQVARVLEANLAKEQQRRVKSEEAAAKRLEAELDKQTSLRDAARDAEMRLRDRLAVQGVEMAQVQTAVTSARQEIAALTRRLEEETHAHGETRRMLAFALKQLSTSEGGSSPPVKRVRRSPESTSRP
ncbi:MAG: DNA-binding protein, partial [Bordetella sp.]|nr:DNA-binding protein [Bordetella sp.]